MKTIFNEKFLKKYLEEQADILHDYSLLMICCYKFITLEKGCQLYPHWDDDILQSHEEKANDILIGVCNELGAEFGHGQIDLVKRDFFLALLFLFDCVNFPDDFEIDLNNEDSFIKCFINLRLLAVLYRRFDLVKDFLSKDDQYLFLILDAIKTNVTQWRDELVGYWKAKGKVKQTNKMSGGRAKTEKMEERIEKAANMLKKNSKLTEHGLEIKRKGWEQIFNDIEIYTYPTKKKYKEAIEGLLSQKIILK